MKVCPDCGTVITEDVPACPDCGAALGAATAPVARRPGRRKGGKVRGRGPAWAGSFWGAFGYSYAAVMARDGWKSWFRFLLAGVGTPILIILLMRVPLFGCLAGCFGLILIPVVMFGAIVGSMYYYMAHSAARGLTPVQEAKPQIWGDMIVPFFQALCSTNLLVAGPIVAGWLIAKYTGVFEFSELQDLSGEGVEGIKKIGALMASSGMILGGVALGIYCYPMQLMLLGASQSLSKTANPINMVKALLKSIVPYTGLCLFFMLNLIATPVLITVAVIATAIAGQVPFGGLIAFAVIMGIAIYMASVNGWRMGMFLYNNPKVFDHVQ